MDTVTLVIAVFGAVTGAASLGWSVASHVLSGGRVQVELRAGWLVRGGLVLQPLTKARVQMVDGAQAPILAVRAANTGRLPVTVESWAVKVGKVSIGQVTHAVNPVLPHPLGVGESATWIVALAEVLKAADGARSIGLDFEELRGTVTLGAGKLRRSKRSPARSSDLPMVFGASPD